MSNFFDGLGDEEKEFFGDAIEEKKEQARFSKQKAAFFKWPKGDFSQYIGFIHIPESKKDKFGGTVALPKVYKMHRGIFVSEKFMKPGRVSLFPGAKRYNIRCAGKGCIVCQKVNTEIEKSEKRLDSGSLTGPAKAAEEDRLKQLQGMKAKKRRVWVGLDVSKKEDKTFEKKFVIFDFADFFWQQSFTPFLTEKSVDFEDWCEENEDGLHGLSREEIEIKYIKEAAPARSMPWDHLHGYFVRLDRTGPFGQYKWKVVDRNKFPIAPFKIPSKAKGKALEKYEKLLEMSKANNAWLKEQFKNGAVPDLDYYYEEMTPEKQATVLGINMDVEEEMDDEDFDSIDDAAEADEVVVKEKVDEVDLDDFDDDDGDDDDDELQATEEAAGDDEDDDEDLDDLDDIEDIV